MIFTERQITVRKGKATIDEPVILYRGDFEVSIKFTIMESKFRFKSGVNLVDSEKASFGQLAILAPYGGNVFSEIVKCEDGTVTFTLTKEMIDQLEEVGLYSFQIRLFDYYRESRVSIPPVEFGIEVREPVASEDHDNKVNNAIVGYSIAKVVDGLNEDVPDTFDANGNYNKTDWETGDRITEGKLNKIEDAIDKINQNEIGDKNALNKQMTSNFNVLTSQLAQKADKDEYVKKGYGTLNDFNDETRKAILENNNIDINYVLGLENVINENIADNSVDFSKVSFINLDKSVNVFNKTKTIEKVQIDSTTGDTKAHEESCVTEYIKVFPGDVIRSTSSWEGAFYDSSKNFLSGKKFGVTEITAPFNARYYRESIKTNLINITMITINNDLPETYQPYYDDKIVFDVDFKTEIKKSAKENIVKPNDTDFFNKVVVNLFDKEKLIDFKSIDIETGELKEHVVGCVSDFIEVNPTCTYTTTGSWEGAFYDLNKKFLSGKKFGVTTFEVPSDAYFFRYAINMSTKDNEMMVEGYWLPEEYIPHTEDLFFTKERYVESIYKQLHPLNGKKWVVVGDSLTEKNIRTTKNYHDYIKEETGVIVYNMGVGGTGYKRAEENGTAFYQRVVDIPTDADIITIFGSGNDLGGTVGISKLGLPTDTTTDTICGCMNITIEKIFERIPGARIGIVLPCPWGNCPPYQQENPMAKYSEALREVAKRYSIPVLDLYYGSNLRPWDETFKNLYYKRDEGNYVHPDEDGHKILANKFKMFIQSL